MDLRFGAVLFNYRIQDMIEKSIRLEQNGFNSIWLTDVLFEGGPDLVLPDVIPAMTAIGMSTKRILVGTSVIDALSRHPAKLAAATATIDSLLNGRSIFGIGAGEIINHEPFGISTYDAFTRLRETVQILQLLWTADSLKPASFQGKYYAVRDAYIKIKPSKKPHPPVYLPAFGPKMLAMTGELADGWIPQGHTPETYCKFLNGPIKESLARTGKRFDNFDPANVMVACVSKDREQAAKTALEIRHWMVWSPDILRIAAPKLRHPGKRQPYIKSRDKGDIETQLRLAEEIPRELALRATLWGTIDDCIQQLELFIKAGLRHPILFFIPTPNESVDEMIRIFGSEVIPYFRDNRL
jgi:5,10-methylenetetrahydromethanopterin reductase